VLTAFEFSEAQNSGKYKMIKIFTHRIDDFWHCEQGATLVEYGIAIALAITLGAGALLALGGEIGDAMTLAGTQMPN
jgi:Flp pilus assembly pilin Flp